MWIFMNDSFLSIVRHRTKAGHLLVRARVAGDIERVFGGIEVEHNSSGDYPFRAVISDLVVMNMINLRITCITYDNFKDSVPDSRRALAYHEVWNILLYKLQTCASRYKRSAWGKLI